MYPQTFQGQVLLPPQEGAGKTQGSNPEKPAPSSASAKGEGSTGVLAEILPHPK